MLKFDASCDKPYRLCVEGDGAAGAGGTGGASAAPSGDGTPAAAVGSDAPGGAPASAPSLLSDAKADPAPAAEAAAAETDEQKAARLAAETPEQKTEREAKEKADADTARVEALKPYTELKLPEGMPADQPAFTEFKDICAEAKLDPGVSQKLIDAVAPKLMEAIQAPHKQWGELQLKWIGETKSDAEFGGANLEKNLGLAAKAIDHFGGTEAGAFREMLGFTGVGNNPEFARMLVRIGKAISEGTPVVGRPASGEQKTTAQKIYGKMASEA